MTNRPSVVAGVASPAGRSVVRWAAAEAHARDAELRLVTARLTPDRDARAADLLRTLANEVGGAVTTAVVAGRPGAVLRTAAADADLLVVGADDASPFMEAISGSVPGDLLTTAPCPLVVVPRLERPTGAAAPVVVALTGAPAEDAVLAYGFATASRSHRPLTVLRCGPAEPPDLTDFAHRYPHVPITAVRTDTDPRIALATASRNAALLVLGARDRGRSASGLFGSISRDLIRRSSCPVVVARTRLSAPDGALPFP